jgi:hypothetical protein
MGKKLWFAPRRWGGWGWTPVTWEGWAVVVVFIVALVIGALVLPAKAIGPSTLALAIMVVGVCVAKGTAPGGPNAWRAFQESRKPRP